ncbi:MAG: glycosyltransferase [Aphanocapsa sp. GSE-SYN-MK-11-07L]|jgi:glycosyltransferase involved in cell wall biosynthesis|nr:glycosyltransferase [Aphanocapsa sp. GSE-SYN-MK-11-07L]
MTIESTPIVSVILPTFNRAHLLPRTIKSVFSQTLSNFELIIVNDGSTDNTLAVLAQISDPRIVLIDLPRNFGATYARNAGIAAARAELVAFLDSDDEWLPATLELQVDRLNSSADPLASVVYADEVFSQPKSATNQASPALSVAKPYEGDVFYFLCTRELCPSTSMVLVKRSALIRVGGFDINLPSQQDCDLFLKLAYTSNHFLAVNQPLVIKNNNEFRISNDLDAKVRGIEVLDCKWGKIIKQRFGDAVYRQWLNWLFDVVDRLKIRKAASDGKMMSAWITFLGSLGSVSHNNFWGRVKLLLVVLLKQDEQVYKNLYQFYQRKLKHRPSNPAEGQSSLET